MKIAVIIPTLNHRERVNNLSHNIIHDLGKNNFDYKIFIFDQGSKDDTVEHIKSLTNIFPVEVEETSNLSLTKRVKKKIAKIDVSNIIVVDPDSTSLNGAFNKLLGSLNDQDVLLSPSFGKGGKRQIPGVAIFKKNVISHILETGDQKERFFLWNLVQHAKKLGYQIDQKVVDKDDKNTNSVPWFEAFWASLKLKFSNHSPYYTPPESDENMKGAGVSFRKNQFVTHSTLRHQDAAIYRTSIKQKIVIIILLGTLVVFGITNFHLWLVLFVSTITILYFIDLLFNLYLITNSLRKSPEIKISKKQISKRKGKWPKYTVFCPLYKEVEVLPQFIEAISNLDYPKDRLEIMLLLEEDDKETILAARNMNLPSFFRIVIVPHSLPKTKPKACNYGLAHAQGEYAVIYDAEDIPDTDQLKKAVLTFEEEDDDVVCIQAKLNYYNPNQNILTRLFTAEYSLWFDLILTGLQSIHAPIPLGGTSNHFRTCDLNKLEGWDPFNVTEDADLGMRLIKRGYRTAIMDSMTMEEANSNLSNWFKQRSRWVKGYMQTYLVHMRRPGEFISDVKNHHVLTFQLIVGGKILSMLINPFMWVMTISYFAFRSSVGSYIESLYLTPIFYLATFTLIIGNFLYLYYYVLGLLKREYWGLIKYTFFVPLYWIVMSGAAAYAAWELLVRPHHWNKTHHGLHLKKTEPLPGVDIVVNPA